MNKTPKLFYSKDEVEEERKTLSRVIYPIINKDLEVIELAG